MSQLGPLGWGLRSIEDRDMGGRSPKNLSDSTLREWLAATTRWPSDVPLCEAVRSRIEETAFRRGLGLPAAPQGGRMKRWARQLVPPIMLNLIKSIVRRGSVGAPDNTGSCVE